MSPLPPTRRGACPAFLAPMQTGDGLILRLVPDDGALSPTQLAGLAAAARRYGNSLMEITARGSLQMRGLREETVGQVQVAVRALGIEPRMGIAVDTSPLSGIDPAEIADARRLADALRAGAEALLAHLGPKVSVVVDGGGAVSLAGQKADVRLAAEGGGWWSLTIGGSAPRVLLEAEAAAEALAALTEIAALGRTARATDLPGCAGRPGKAMAHPALGRIPLADGTSAFGIGLPFGAGDASLVEAITAAAAAAGARDLRPAPERVLLATGLDTRGADGFAAAAQALGCLVDRDDPRAFVAACAGAPACASAYIPARTLAPLVARTLAPLLDGTVSVHLSACIKGCAHPAPSTLALVGMDGGVALVHEGPASAAGVAREVAELPAALAALAAAARRRPGETGRAALARLDAAGLWARDGKDAGPMADFPRSRPASRT